MYSFLKIPNNQQDKSRLRRWMEKQQRLTADYLNNKTAAWNRQRQLLFLVITGGGYVAGLIFILFSTPVSQGIEHLSVPGKGHRLPDRPNDTPHSKVAIPQDTIIFYHP